ncbi:MAG: Zn-dependent hydrolase [Candidatus Aminicenantes bacterium]|nr:Zn-dependent hydrolase [Candidatus Aminicenantes bacterium]
MDIRIDIARLRRDIEELGRIGCDASGGVSRPSFSPADLQARAWLKDRLAAADLAVRQDGAGNIFGRLGGDGRPVMTGSHIDTVLNGGMFDGAAGVLSSLECLRRIREENVPLAKPLEIVSFTDEEGNLCGDFLGSRAFTGRLNREEIERGLTQLGIPLADILKGTEFSAESILRTNAAAEAAAPEVEAFLELHVEQGAVLDDEGIPVGIVDRFSGKHYRLCSFLGKAGHAGTTPIELRKDAFLGLADFALRSTQHVATRHYGSFVTIGRVAVRPGAFSIVPGQADFTFEFRSAAPETMKALETELFALADDVARTRGLMFVSKIVDSTTPLAVAPRILDVLTEACGRLGIPFMKLTSGAGHDAQIMAAVTDSGMIFVPSPDGVSHSPKECLRWEDLEKAANLLLAALLRLAS